MTRLQTIPVCSWPYRLYTYWITSSRRSDEKSMSTSGYAVRPSLMNRSKSSSWRMGSTRAIPSTYATMEPAALPRPCAGIPRDFANRIRSQQMRKNSARPVLPMTSSSCASCFTTAGVRGWYRRLAPSQQSSERCENGVWPLGTGKPGKRYRSKARSTRQAFAISTDAPIPSRHALASTGSVLEVASSPGGSARRSAPVLRYDSPSGRRRSASSARVRPWRIAVTTSCISRSWARA